MATVRHLILHLQDLIRSLTFPIWKTTGKNKHKGNKATGSLAFDFPQCTVVFLQFAIIVGYVKGQSLEQEHLINTWFMPSFFHLQYLQRLVSPTISLQVSFSFMHISLHLKKLCRWNTNCLVTLVSANMEAQWRDSCVQTMSKPINNQEWKRSLH